MNQLQTVLFGNWVPPKVLATHSYRIMSLTAVGEVRKKPNKKEKK